MVQIYVRNYTLTLYMCMPFVSHKRAIIGNKCRNGFPYVTGQRFLDNSQLNCMFSFSTAFSIYLHCFSSSLRMACSSRTLIQLLLYAVRRFVLNSMGSCSFTGTYIHLTLSVYFFITIKVQQKVENGFFFLLSKFVNADLEGQ